MSRLALTPTNVPASATDLSTPTLRAGDLYYNTTTGLKVYTGSAWTDVSTATSLTEIDAGMFDGIAPYMGGANPSDTASQTVNGGTP
jgi:hypothetical protein